MLEVRRRFGIVQVNLVSALTLHELSLRSILATAEAKLAWPLLVWLNENVPGKWSENSVCPVQGLISEGLACSLRLSAAFRVIFQNFREKPPKVLEIS